MLLSIPSGASAQIAEQVANLLEEAPSSTAGSFPDGFTRLGRRVVFFASSPSSGLELWSTTVSGVQTELLIDTCPGPCGSSSRFFANLENVALWFSQTEGDNDHLASLWRTDGTRGGTYALLVGVPVSSIFSIGVPIVLEGAVIFPLPEENGGWSLWRSNGTQPGTTMLSRLDAQANSSAPEGFTVLDQRVYFHAGPELWSTDGTAEGTRREADLSEIFFSGSPLWPVSGKLFFSAGEFSDLELWTFDPPSGEVELVKKFDASQGENLNCTGVVDSAPDRLFFHAFEPDHGWELWQSEGSAATTRRLTAIEESLPFGECPMSRNIQVFGDTVIFRGREEGELSLLSTTGSPASTEVLLTICQPGTNCFPAGFLTRFGNQALFSAWHPTAGVELWSTDGTRAETRLLKDLCPGECESSPDSPTKLDEDFIFFARDPQDRLVLWRTDGSAAGTETVLTVPDKVEVRSEMARLGNRYFFRGFEPVHGFEPWFTNGTGTGTRLLLDIGTGDSGSGPKSLTPLAGGTTFAASSVFQPGGPLEQNLWFSQGGEENTIQLTRFPGNRPLSNLTTIGGLSFFNREAGGEEQQLWRSDGTTEGTFALRLFQAPTNSSGLRISEVFALGGRPHFLVKSFFDAGLWETDGTEAGTRRVINFDDLGILGFNRHWPAGDQLFFTASTDDSGNSFFATDGTANGTSRIGFADGFPLPFGFVPLGEETFIMAGEGCREAFLLASDGTPQGGRVVGGLPSLGCHNQTGDMVTFGGRLYFIATTVEDFENTGISLWSTDGTETHTSLVRELTLSARFPDDHHLTAADFALFFTPNSPTVGKELWISDGTTGGTRLVEDIRAGQASANIHSLTPVDGRLFFVANDGIHGGELWVSDGTEAGTRLVHDIYPGARSSEPAELTRVGDKLFFSADNGLYGRELWMLPLDGAGPPCRASETALCLQDNRFRVEMQWTDFQDRSGPGRAVPITEDTGYFWFFNPQNVEAILKVLDGRELNSHHWTFYGALSNVEYWLTVTDAETGLTRRYFNPSRNFASVGDNESFGPLGANLVGAPEPLESSATAQPNVVDGQAPEATLGEGCIADETRLCLNGGLFSVEATWADFSGNTGVGQAVSLTDDTGYFWFFNQQNVETVLKVLDGRPNNGAFWVFYGSLSNVDFDLTVTDMQTGAVRTYQNRNRRFASVGDTRAFPEP
ncbi:MAG: hypothetical protein K0U98_15960 [Deltaproteobacteria bacterium]|nr:hypothetical protein [Deltaproteobacteria bacterium]